MTDTKQIASQFAVNGTIADVKPLGSGLINDTLKVSTAEADKPDYVMQRINHNIFQNVDLLQDNIKRITEHIRKKLQQRGDTDIDRKTLTITPTHDGKLYYYDGESYWRMMTFIANSKTYEAVTPELAYFTGRGFGEFQYFLSDLEGAPLGETIPDFHNMEFRVKQMREAVEKNAAGRVAKAQTVIDELLNRADDMCKVQRWFREGKFPKRITHCDTKVNNMLFDQNDKFLCVIDLDTTMPGFVLSDFGDFIRTAGNTGAEDDENLANVGLNMDVFKNFARGYIEAAKSFLTPIEIENLPFGAQLMTYMQTVRFLTDYLNGDTYYKIKSPEHNWQRTLAQLTHLHSIDSHLSEMNEYISKVK